MRLIGDAHGKYDKYLYTMGGADTSVQLGDHGFSYDHMDCVGAGYHKIIGGNHDNYDKIDECVNYLGDFGFCDLRGTQFFHVRGAYSIDWQGRIPGESWWHKEELSLQEMDLCIQLYRDTKPALVLSHDCPLGVLSKVLPSARPLVTNTQLLLQRMLEIHQPARWVFAHYHTSRTFDHSGTLFTCLDELEYIDI